MGACARRLQRACGEDAGFTILEVVIALGLFALVAVGLALSTNTGLDLTRTSNNRQVATQLAARWMEDARATPYDFLGMDPGEQYFTGPDSPDHELLTLDSGTYLFEVGGGFGAEPLVVLPDGPGVSRHDEVQLHGTWFELWRYVTWVPDGTGEPPEMKRVTVIVRWAGTAPAGGPNQVVLSALVGPHGLGWAEIDPEASDPTPGNPTTTTTVPAPAPGDCSELSAPSGSLTILAGTGANTGYTASSTVALSLSVQACGPATMAFSNDGTTWSAEEPIDTSKLWELAPGEGNRTVWVRFTDGAGRSTTYADTVRVDKTPPTTPGSFDATVHNGPWRIVLTWQPSTDNDKLIGYRVYRRVANGGFQNLPPGVAAPCPTAPCSFTDNDVTRARSGRLYTYYVVAYDAAGNESAPTAELTRSL